MSWIQSISSTLKTWVFKHKLLKFSDRYSRDTQACFYCPEMCRFSCDVAETLKTNAVTPRGKMTLLHLAERGFSPSTIAGSEASRLWYLEQCTGCGRCTEFCLYEIDVASNLRSERERVYSNLGKSSGLSEKLLLQFEAVKPRLRGKVLLCEIGRLRWWNDHAAVRVLLGVTEIIELDLPLTEWGQGTLESGALKKIGRFFDQVDELSVESPEAAWFFAKGVKDDAKAFKGEIRTVWQKLFMKFVELGIGPQSVLNESYFLTRLLPRLGYSIPMYERGYMPFHSAWNVWDSGGEGFYRFSNGETAQKMAHRFVEDLRKDGRSFDKIICQGLSAVEHLRAETGVKAVYWLDEIGGLR